MFNKYKSSQKNKLQLVEGCSLFCLLNFVCMRVVIALASDILMLGVSGIDA